MIGDHGDVDRLVRIWAEISSRSHGDPLSVAHLCAALVAAVRVDGAGVTVFAGATWRETVHASDRVAGDLEEWQLTFGEGPCVDAFTGGGPVLAVDLDSPWCLDRWPAFTPAALGSGARAVFALPLQVGAIRWGVLDLYRIRPGPLAPDELADALLFADAAAMLLLDMGAGAQPDSAAPDAVESGTVESGAVESAWHRDDPTSYQAEVHQATGVLMVQLGTSAEAAFARLRARAYASGRRLGDVARDVIERRLRLEPDPAPVDSVLPDSVLPDSAPPDWSPPPDSPQGGNDEQ